MSPSARVRLQVTGRVQGVGFRWFVKETARGLGLAGWVRNEPDGSVLLEVEGPVDDVERLRGAVRKGPPGAFVESMRELPAGSDVLAERFSVER